MNYFANNMAAVEKPVICQITEKLQTPVMMMQEEEFRFGHTADPPNLDTPRPHTRGVSIQILSKF